VCACARVDGSGVDGRVIQQALNGVERHLARHGIRRPHVAKGVPSHLAQRRALNPLEQEALSSARRSSVDSKVGAGPWRKAVAREVAPVVQILVLRGGRRRHDHGREQYHLAGRSV
jgi:hypothetical protein